MNRIRRLLNHPEEPRATAALMLPMGLLLGMFCLFAAANANSQAEGSAGQGTQPGQEMETPYTRWLKEDVAYIISDEERAAFLRLPTDEEREQFIDVFWARRDPTGRTPENEFKNEHYRRIGYANKRFASGMPGSKTDRGRIYIVYGPPDEIESHPNAGTEHWRYRHIDGIGDLVVFEFADPTHSGEFRLNGPPKPTEAEQK